MAIRHFTFDPAAADLFVRFSRELYQDDPNWIPPFKEELGAQLSPEFPFYRKSGNSHRHFVATAGGKVIGHISAMVNGELQDRDGTPVGTVGFFECINDDSVAQQLLSSATRWLHEEKEIDRIWGPMNFDIWHGYRFMTRGFDQKPFLGEPYNKPYYPEFFERFGFSRKCEWDSVEIAGRDPLERMIARGAKRYQLLVDRGYRFELFNPRRFGDELRKLHLVMTKSFGGFLGFTPLSFEELRPLFSKARHALHPRLFMFTYDENDNLAGFAAAFLELSDAVRSMKGRNSLLAKLKFAYHRARVNRINFYIGGVTPEEVARRSGLGRAGFYYIINQILNEGFETVMLTLRLKGNFSHGLAAKDPTVPQREYALYELNP